MNKLTVLILVLLVTDIESTNVLDKNRRESTVCFRDFNYHASIRVEYDKFYIHHCSGAVLDNDHIITVASCIYDLSPVDIKVVVGSGLYDPIFAVESWYPINSVAHAYVHKKFNGTYFKFAAVDYDIAIIQTEKSLQPLGKFSTIAPASAAINILDGQHATMTLWNIVDAHEGSFNELLRKDGRKANDYQCECVYSGLMSTQMMCYDFDQGCYGEAGAPLAMLVEGSFVLIGIYSWHGDCTNLTYPAVFTRISQFNDWIQDVVGYMPPKIQCKPFTF